MLAKNATEVATSKGCPARPSGTFVPKYFESSPVMLDMIRGVHMGPGATPLTRIFFLAKANAKDLVNETIAPFVEE